MLDKVLKSGDSTSRAGSLRTLLITAWVLAVVSIVGVIANQDQFFALDNKRVAALEQKNGPVLVRSEGLVRWQETVERQGLFDGDRIATGRGGAARISFGTGRALNLGEDTQIQITSIVTRDQEPAFMITLLRGTMVAAIEGKCKDCPPIVVRAGDETYRVGVGKRVGVFKPAGRKAKEFRPRGPWPAARSVPQPIIAKDFVKPNEPETAEAAEPETVATSTPTPTPTPSPSPSPKPALLPMDVIPEVKAPSQGVDLYTVQPLSALGNAQIAFPLVPAKARPQGKWRPVLLVSGEGARASVLQAGVPTVFEIKVPVTKIRGVASVSNVGLFKDYRFNVKAGVAMQGTRAATYGKTPLSLRIRSYGDWGGGPVTLGMDRFVAQAEQGPWVAAKGEVPAKSAPIVIQLAAGADAIRLLPFVRAAGKLGVMSGGPESGSGIFVVRERAVVAQLRGGAISPDVIHQVMVRLGADFVFEGNRVAFNDTRGSSQTAVVDKVDSLLNQGKVLYILKRNKLYPVSRDFIKTNTEVAQFVDSQAKAIFLEKVTILDYR